MDAEHLVLAAGVVDLDRRRLSTGDGEVRLTALDVRLVRCLLTRAPEVVTHDQLLAEVWGYQPQVQTQALEQAVRRLRRKLELDPAEPAHILTEYGVGYRLVPLVRPELAPLATRRTNLPDDRDGFVGRHDELAAVRGWLAGSERVLTVKGPGGMGKTRLALHAMGSCSSGLPPGGLWLVDLGEARDRADLLSSVFGALRGTTADPSEAAMADEIRRVLVSRGEVWLLLDNVEQIVDSVAEVLGDWLDSTRGVRFVITSRERLAIPGERVLELGPLSPGDALALWRLRTAQAGAVEAVDDDEVIEAIAARLDRIPLALELAAARAHLYTPVELLATLDTAGALHRRRGVAPRHATIEACLAWSWDLLTPTLRDALAELSVFRGGFTLEALAAVVELPAGTAPADVLQGLIDRSMVQVSRTADGSRYALLELIRAFAAERLGDRSQAAEDRHTAWFAEGSTQSPIQVQRHDGRSRRAIHRDLDNFRAASDRAWARGRFAESARAACAVIVAVMASQPPVARRYLERALGVPEALPGPLRWRLQELRIRQDLLQSSHDRALVGLASMLHEPDLPDATRADLLLLRGGVLVKARRFDEAGRQLHAGLELADEDHPGRPAALGNLAVLCEVAERHEEAGVRHQQVLELLQRAGHTAATPLPRIRLGNLALRAGNLGSARRLLEQGVETARAQRADYFQSLGLGWLSAVLREQGSALEALRCARWSAELAQRVGDIWLVTHAMQQVGRTLLHLGRVHDAWRELTLFREHLVERNLKVLGVEEFAAIAKLAVPRGGKHLELTMLTCRLGMVAARRGDLPSAREARTAARRAWELAERPRRPDVLRALDELELRAG